MKNNLILIFILSFCIKCFSQKNAQIFTDDSDPSYWSQYVAEKIKRFGLPEIENSKGIVFRLSSYGNMVEVRNENKLYSGELWYFVTEQDDSRNDKRIFKKSFSLNPEIVKKVFDLIDSTKVNSVPSSKFFDSWENYIDPTCYFLESKYGTSNSFKSYCEPNYQKIDEAKTISNFIDRFYRLIEFEKYKSEFKKQIPFFAYSYTDGFQTVIRKLSDKELKAYNRRKKKKEKREEEY